MSTQVKSPPPLSVEGLELLRAEADRQADAAANLGSAGMALALRQLAASAAEALTWARFFLSGARETGPAPSTEAAVRRYALRWAGMTEAEHRLASGHKAGCLCIPCCKFETYLLVKELLTEWERDRAAEGGAA